MPTDGPSSGLRRHGGDGSYVVSGSLDGIAGPGRRTVTDLVIRDVGPGADLDLSRLSAFPDLRGLRLERVDGVSLRPLEELPLGRLSLDDVRCRGGGSVGALTELAWLSLSDVDQMDAEPLALPASLRSLSVAVRRADRPAMWMRHLIDDTDWSVHRDLLGLKMSVDSSHPEAPFGVDLGLLRGLPSLRRLVMREGLVHRGERPSPLEPPFDGLSRALTAVRFEADGPERVTLGLTAILLDAAEVVVTAPVAHETPRPPWTVTADPDGGSWGAYGRLMDAGHGETEYDACRRARGQLRRLDRPLLERLEFDPEADGTGIAARSEEDLRRALELLGLGAGIEPRRGS